MQNHKCYIFEGSSLSLVRLTAAVFIFLALFVSDRSCSSWFMLSNGELVTIKFDWLTHQPICLLPLKEACQVSGGEKSNI